MFNSLIIENFRGFKKLEVGPLDSVNLIAARNNGGKTALLEALRILLHPTDPTEIIRIYDDRDMTSSGRIGYADLWAWLIHNRDFTSGCAHIGAQSGEKHIEIKLCLENTLPDQVSIPARDIADKQLLQDFRYELTMIYKPGEGEIGTTTTVRPSPDRYPSLSVRYDGPPPSWPAKSVSISPCPGLRSGVVEMFSELAKTHDDEHVLKVAKRVEKRLERLSVQLLGAQPLLHADLGGKELVPLRLMGDGFQRLVEILVVIFAARGGVVLIDEIENGLHYSALRELWGAIYEASQAAGVQIFATTHSYECIKTAHEVFREHDPYRLRLHRLDFDEKRGTFATTFDKDTLEAALDHLWEIR